MKITGLVDKKRKKEARNDDFVVKKIEKLFIGELSRWMKQYTPLAPLDLFSHIALSVYYIIPRSLVQHFILFSDETTNKKHTRTIEQTQVLGEGFFLFGGEDVNVR